MKREELLRELDNYESFSALSVEPLNETLQLFPVLIPLYVFQCSLC